MEFSPKHRRSTCGYGRCCVPNCNSKKNVDLHLSFHKVPGEKIIQKKGHFGQEESVNKRQEWLRSLDVKDNGKQLLVCSLHFTNNDYNFPDMYTKVRALKKSALPTKSSILPQRDQKVNKTSAKHCLEHNYSCGGNIHNSIPNYDTLKNNVDILADKDLEKLKTDAENNQNCIDKIKDECEKNYLDCDMEQADDFNRTSNFENDSMMCNEFTTVVVKKELVSDDECVDVNCEDSTAFPTVATVVKQEPELIEPAEELQMQQMFNTVVVKEESVSDDECVDVNCKDSIEFSTADTVVKQEPEPAEKELVSRQIINSVVIKEEEFFDDTDVKEELLHDDSGQCNPKLKVYQQTLKKKKSGLQSDDTKKPLLFAGPHKCPLCSRSFPHLSSLTVHYRTHSVGKPFKCDLCPKSFSQSQDVTRHRLTHTEKKPHTCDLCPRSFADLPSLTVHHRKHTEQKPYKCDLCPKTFRDAEYISLHRLTHSGVRPYKCDICSKSFTQQHCLTTHQRIHTGEKPFKCDLCLKSFLRSASVINHRRIHTGEKPYKCDLCDKSFKQLSHLTLHRHSHTGEKLYECDVCHKSFVRLPDLNRHRRRHTGEKPYKCDLCQKQFVESQDLTRHLRRHTGEKPYKCDLCEKQFVQSQDLTRHLRTHTGEKPHKCDLCHKAFSCLSQMTRHRRVHTGEKPYKCDVCQKSFTRSSQMTRHRLSH